MLSGWEGSAADATVYHDARVHELTIPPGKYYLADTGFPSCPELLVPFRGQRDVLRLSEPFFLFFAFVDP